jgi:hypothetical protein
MGLAWSSVAALAMAPLQDLVNLGRESRMNIPGRPEGNWCWRCTEDTLSDPAFEWLRDLTKNSNRSGALLSPHTGKMLEALSRTGTQLSYWPTAWNTVCGQETWGNFIHWPALLAGHETEAT